MPTFIAVVFKWMNSNGRLSDLRSEMNARFGEVNSRISDLRNEMKDMKADLQIQIKDSRDLLLTELHGLSRY